MPPATLTASHTTARYKAVAPFRPLAWQVAPWQDRSLTLLMTGSAGGGKSVLAANKAHGYCLKYPGAVVLLLRKAREYATQTIVPLYHGVIGGAGNVTYNATTQTFKYSNGSIAYVRGMKDDAQREAVRSMNVDLVWMEEANKFIREDYNELLARMRGHSAPWRQIMLTTNPGGSRHWIYTDLIRGKRASVYYSGANDNPHNPPDYLDNLSHLTGVQYQRLVLGHWVQAEGAVYDTFDHATHAIERRASELTRYALAIDEGYTNPAVILLIGQDSDGRMHVAREWYQRGVLQEKVVAQARAWQLEYGCELIAVDAAAAGLVADLRNAGVPATPHKGRVLDGIQAVQNLLKVQGDGRPRLTVDPACENTITEFETYSWRVTADGGTRDEPAKEHDHAMDALRYLVIAWSGAGARLVF